MHAGLNFALNVGWQSSSALCAPIQMSVINLLQLPQLSVVVDHHKEVNKPVLTTSLPAASVAL